MLHKIQVTIMILLIPVLGLYWYADQHNMAFSDFLFPAPSVLHLGDIPVNVEVADTPDEWELGLSGRTEMNTQGLLFIFDEPAYHKIWMKDMRFPIDVIWISDDLKIVGITEGLSPDSYPKIFEPPQPVRYVLETGVHFAETFGIREGDSVRLPLEYK